MQTEKLYRCFYSQKQKNVILSYSGSEENRCMYQLVDKNGDPTGAPVEITHAINNEENKHLTCNWNDAIYLGMGYYHSRPPKVKKDRPDLFGNFNSNYYKLNWN